MSTIIFAGLGNFGTKYENTFHNAGFLCLDSIFSGLSSLSYQSNWLEKYSGLYAVLPCNGYKILFIKPQTYMNNSGVCVAQFKNFFKIPNENIFIFHDDLDLKFCQIKTKNGGGNGGHNGLKSIDANIGNDYNRIRIGIGRPTGEYDVANFVLSLMKNDQIDAINSISNLIIKNIIFLLEKKFSIFQENMNSNF